MIKGLALLAWMGLGLWGITGLVIRKLAPGRRRTYSLCLLLICWALMGLLMDLFPVEDQVGKVTFFWPMTMISVLLGAVAAFLLIQIKRMQLRRGASLATKGILTKSAVAMETRWPPRGSCAPHHSASVAQIVRKAQEKGTPRIVATKRDISSRAVKARLEDRYQEFRRRAIRLDDYRRAIMSEREAVRDEIRFIRANKGKGEAAEALYQFAMEDAEEALQATEWRLAWVAKLDERDRDIRDMLGIEYEGDDPAKDAGRSVGPDLA